MRSLVLATLAAVAVGATACSDGGGGTAVAPPSITATTTPPTTVVRRDNVDGQLVVGVLVPTTGPGAALGESLTAAVELAAQEINANGGVNGRPIVIAHRDEGVDAATATLALDQLLNEDDVDAIVGPASSKVALSIVDRVTDARVVTCSPTATAIALTDVPDGGYFFRTMPSDALQAIAMGRAIDETGRNSTAIMYPDDDYGRAFSEALRSTLEGRGNAISAIVSYDATADQLTDVVDRALANLPEAVAVIGLPAAGGKILAGLLAAGINPAVNPVFVSDGMRSANLFEEVSPGRPESVVNIVGTAPAAGPAGAEWFSTGFASYVPGTPDLFGSYAYDCMNLIALSAQAARSDDPETFRRQMAASSNSGVICRSFPDCAPDLAAGRNIDLDGASGAIELTSTGDPAFGRYEVFQYGSDGKDTRIEVKPIFLQ